MLSSCDQCVHHVKELLTAKSNPGMRRELENKSLMGVQILEGKASSMAGVESQSVDAVVVAQVRPSISTALLT